MQLTTSRIYGLNVASAMSLPGLPTDQTTPDVVIIEGACPADLQDAHTKTPNLQISKQACLLNVPSLGKVYLERSGTITLDVDPNMPESWKVSLALGSGLGTWLHMHGITPLHGVAWAEGAHATIALGPSGAGKSTLAAAVIASGKRLISDDVIALKTDSKTKKILAVPAHARIKISGHDLAKWRSQETHRLFQEPWRVTDEPVLPESPKLGVTVPVESMQDEALPIKRCFLLSKRTSDRHDAEVSHLPPKAALIATGSQIYRRRLSRTLGHSQRHFEQLAALSQQCRTEKVRPSDLSVHCGLGSYASTVLNI